MEAVGLAWLGAGLGMGLAVFGGGLGIGRLVASALEGMARQPEAGNDIRGAMIVGAALIEGAVLFCFVICILLALKVPV